MSCPARQDPDVIRSGFSLLELCVVVTLISCGLVLLFHGSALYDRILVKMELERIQLFLMTMARTARIRGKACSLRCSTQDNSIVCIQKDMLPAEAFRCLPGVIFGVSSHIAGPPSAPEKPVKDPITFVDHIITFEADGHMGAGTIYLTDTKRRWHYALSCSVGTVLYLRRYFHNGARWVLL